MRASRWPAVACFVSVRRTGKQFSFSHSLRPTMRILVLGGTQFVGRHIVAALLERGGHHVTLLNRGRTENPFGDSVEAVRGDRCDREQVYSVK